MKRGKIRVLSVGGTAYDMGWTHGEQYREEIRRYAAERVALVEEGQWSGKRPLTRQQVLGLAEACLPAHEAYAPDLMDELRGMAAATDLSLAELIIVGGFTDFIDTVYRANQRQTLLEPALAIDDCTAFIIPDDQAQGAGFLGQTWDMHDTATEFVIMLRIEEAEMADALLFTSTGCLGQIGMNAHGIAVGINNLLGADGQFGVTWPFVIRKVLQQDNIEDALACITEAPLAGAHNYLLFDGLGNGFNVEAMSSHHVVTSLNGEAIVHTNHCLMPETQTLAQPRLPASQAHSENRLSYAQEVLAERPVTIEHLQELTRQAPVCTISTPPFHVESCGAAIMRPKSGDLWAVWGVPCDNEYEQFRV